MWTIGDKLCVGIQKLFREFGIQAIVQSVGPMFQIMFTTKPFIRDYREFCASVDRAKYQKFSLALFEYGVYMSPSASLHSVATLAHREDDIAFTLEAMRNVLKDGKI